MAFKCTRGSLERLCSAFRDHMSNRNYSHNLELKSFLLSYYHINEKTAASGKMSEYERMGLVRTLPKHMWTKAVDELCLALWFG